MSALGVLVTVGVLAPGAGAVAVTEYSMGLGAGQWPAYITPGPDGNVWFTLWGCGLGPSSPSCAIARITPAGTIAEFSSGLAPNSFPTTITNGPEGDLYFADSSEGGAAHAIGRVTPTGSITELSGTLANNAFPGGITTGPDGNLWLDTGGSSSAVLRVTPAGATHTFTDPSLPPSGMMRAIVRGPDGNLWFTEYDGTNPIVGRVTTSGAITTFPLPTGSAPQGIAAGSDGNLWVTDAGSTPSIHRITPAGAMTSFSAGLPAGASPRSITLGADGNLWYIDLSGGHAAIGRITPAGTINEFTNGIASNSLPREIAAGPDGNVWFTDQACNGGPGTCAVGRVALQLPPAVANGDSIGVSATGAQITGTVNPRGAAVSRIVVRFQAGHGTPRLQPASPVSLPPGGTPVSVSARLTGLPPQQTITYAIQATNAFGTTTGPTQTLRTGRGPAPAISSLTQSHQRWRRGTRRASISRRRTRSPVGTTFSFRLDEAAALQVQFSRVSSGRRLGRRCLAPTSRNRHRPRCTRLRSAGTLRFSGHSGRNRIRFEGRLTARRSIATGTYQVRIVATAFGTSRRSRALTFHVVAR